MASVFRSPVLDISLVMPQKMQIAHAWSSSALSASPPVDTDLTYKREASKENADQAHIKCALYVFKGDRSGLCDNFGRAEILLWPPASLPNLQQSAFMYLQHSGKGKRETML